MRETALGIGTIAKGANLDEYLVLRRFQLPASLLTRLPWLSTVRTPAAAPVLGRRDLACRAVTRWRIEIDCRHLDQAACRP